jgi:outer membrane protein OmpA-like peptidoglycan-associated protein/opacity protein-like surface antigen
MALLTRHSPFPASVFLLLFFTAAHAQTGPHDADGYYIRLDTGYAMPRDAGASGGPITGKVNGVDASPLLGAGLGYRFNRHFRTDLTSSYAASHQLDDTDAGGNRWKADLDAWTSFVNLYYDHPLGNWSPYLTAGAGLSRNRLGSITRSPNSLTIGGKTTTEFAWQAGAGVGYAFSPNWSLDLGYRHVDAGQFRSGDRASGGGGNTIKGDLRSHVALLGMRYTFWTPPPPVAAPAPTPAAAAVPPALPPAPTGRGVPELPVLYRVFFDWDKADITSESARTLQEAANTAKAVPVTRIVATGHADRSGTERYNMALSLRRASAVKAMLIRDGVPENQIVILGRGERENLVPTPDGAREMLNRRVEIVIE